MPQKLIETLWLPNGPQRCSERETLTLISKECRFAVDIMCMHFYCNLQNACDIYTYLVVLSTAFVSTVVAASIDVAELPVAAKHQKISSCLRFEWDEIVAVDSAEKVQQGKVCLTISFSDEREEIQWKEKLKLHGYCTCSCSWRFCNACSSCLRPISANWWCCWEQYKQRLVVIQLSPQNDCSPPIK